MQRTLLIGNTFPFALLRRDANVRTLSLDALRDELAGAQIASFWGHENTRAAAEAVLGGVSLRPATERPVLTLTPDGFPTLGGRIFRSCFVLAPDYRPGYRPAIGEEPGPSDILGWHALRIDWLRNRKSEISDSQSTPTPERASRT